MKTTLKIYLLLILFATNILLYLSGFKYTYLLAYLAYTPLFIIYFKFNDNKIFKKIVFFAFLFFILFLLNTEWLKNYNLKFQVFSSIIVTTIFTTFILITLLLSKKLKQTSLGGIIILPLILTLSFGILAHYDNFPSQLMPIFAFFKTGTLLKLTGINGFHVLYFTIQSIGAFYYNKFKKNKTLKYMVFILIIIFFSSISLINTVIATPTDYNITVALIQPKFFENWNTKIEHPNIYFNEIYETTKKTINLNPNIIIWPEYSITYPLNLNYKWLNKLLILANESNTILVIGAKGALNNSISNYDNINDPYYDSAFVIYPNWSYDRYDSSLIAPMNNNVIHDKFKELIFEVKGIKFGILICWEEMSFLRAQKYADSGVDYVLIIANDQRFELDKRPYILAQSAARTQSAITGIPQIRLANTGISYITDKNGIVVYEMDFNKKETGIFKI